MCGELTGAGVDYSLETVSGPASEPLSLDETKLHLRVEHTADDSLISGLISAARYMSESYTNRRWISQTLKVSYRWWPRGPKPPYGNAMALPVEPVSEISSVQYVDGNGTVQTLASTAYQTWLVHSPPLVAPARATVWPAIDGMTLSPVRVTFVAGYGSASSVPDHAKNAMKLSISNWYEHRGDGKEPHDMGLPPAAKRLLDLLHDGSYR